MDCICHSSKVLLCIRHGQFNRSGSSWVRLQISSCQGELTERGVVPRTLSCLNSIRKQVLNCGIAGDIFLHCHFPPPPPPSPPPRTLSCLNSIRKQVLNCGIAGDIFLHYHSPPPRDGESVGDVYQRVAAIQFLLESRLDQRSRCNPRTAARVNTECKSQCNGQIIDCTLHNAHCTLHTGCFNIPLTNDVKEVDAHTQ